MIHEFRTDKVGNGYMPTYHRLAAELGPAARVTEIGIEGGYGLEMWQTLFPQGQIIGVDVNPAAVAPPGVRKIIMSQDDERLPGLIGEQDLIVDDASHFGPETERTLAHLWPNVRPGGYYVVEDWGVGFDTFEGFDSSMLWFAEGLLQRFKHAQADASVESITYSVGLIVLKKAAQAALDDFVALASDD